MKKPLGILSLAISVFLLFNVVIQAKDLIFGYGNVDFLDSGDGSLFVGRVIGWTLMVIVAFSLFAKGRKLLAPGEKPKATE